MALPFYLAMTSWEFQSCPQLPTHTAWMACHFSPYTPGLSNMPQALPENSLLMVNDRIPPHGHDPSYIAQQLIDAVQQFQPRGVVLDFQRPFDRETQQIAIAIQKALPCPVAVTPIYAEECSGAVFLPPVLPNQRLFDHLNPWVGREIWLETEKPGLCLTLRDTGCTDEPFWDLPEEVGFPSTELCCHYRIQVMENQAVFSLYRTPEDQEALLEQAEKSGVTLCVGLYQQFR